MALTTNGLPYPVGTDLVVDGDDAIRALAEALDPRVPPPLTSALVGLDTAKWNVTEHVLQRRYGMWTLVLSMSNKIAEAFGPGSFSCGTIPAVAKGTTGTFLQNGSAGYSSAATPTPQPAVVRINYVSLGVAFYLPVALPVQAIGAFVVNINATWHG